MHFWRRALLRLFGARIATGAVIYPSVAIWAPWNLIMEEGSCLGPAVRCYNVAPVTIGARAVISQYAHLCSAGHDPHRSDFPLVTGPISIGRGAWVAADAFVSPGIAVGERAIVAARAVVVRDVPAETVVGGNPAAEIGRRRAGEPL